jgi:hypothetical protein
MNESQIKEQNLTKLLTELLPLAQIRGSVVNDKDFIESLSNKVADKLLERGIIEDKILSVEETLTLLGIKSRITLKRLSENGLSPVYLRANSLPKYRLSDVNRYLNELTPINGYGRRRRARKPAKTT